MGEQGSRFRVGDRVRLLEDNSPLFKGTVYPVTCIKGFSGPDGRPFVGVRGRSVSGELRDDMGCYDRSLELVERTKFEPGDRVRAIRAGTMQHRVLGHEAVVVDVGEFVWVRFLGLWSDGEPLSQFEAPSSFWPVEHVRPCAPRGFEEVTLYEAPTPTYSVEAELRAELSKARQVIETLEQEVAIRRAAVDSRNVVEVELRGALAMEREAHRVTCHALERFKQSTAEQSLELLRESRRANEAVALLRALHDADERLDRERDATEEFLDRLDGADTPF